MAISYEFHDPGKIPFEERAIKRQFCLDNGDEYRVSYVIPITLDDARRPAFRNILKVLAKDVHYIKEYIFSLDKANQQEAEEIRKLIEDFAREKKDEFINPRVVFIWNDAPPLADEKKGFYTQAEPTIGESPKKKGRSMFISNGYKFLNSHENAIIYQDGDIIKKYYEDDFIPLSLCYQQIDPKVKVQFTKAYYHRVHGKDKELKGRVNRFFEIYREAQKEILGGKSKLIRDYLDFISKFKYLLSGEFGMTSKLSALMPFPKDFGIEVGTASFLYSLPKVAIGLANLGEFDHKHSGINNLETMVIEVYKSQLRELNEVAEDEILKDKILFEKTSRIFGHYEDIKMNEWATLCEVQGYTLNGAKDRENNQVFKECLEPGHNTFISNPEGVNPYPGLKTIPTQRGILKRKLNDMKKDYGLIVLENRQVYDLSA